MTSFKSGTFKTWVHNLYKNECTFMKGMPSSILLEGVPRQRSWGTSSYSDSPSYGKEYHRSWRLSGPGFTFAEGHTRWWTLGPPRSSHPQRSVSRHVEIGRELWAKKWHILLSRRIRIFKNWQAPRVFQMILYMSVENTIPWQKIWFTLYKEHGDMVGLHKHHSQKGHE